MKTGPTGSAALIAIAGALVLVSVVVDRRTPAALLTPPDRPYAVRGNPDVRMGSTDFPRRATGADDVETVVDRPPHRIVSQYWSTDEYLYSIVPPDRVVGVSDSAYLEHVSNVYALVERYRPIVATDPERVLRADPDLVFTPESARADVAGLFRQAGLPVYRMFTTTESLASIEDHIRLVGYLTGEDARAEAELQRFRAAVARAAARRPAGVPAPRVLGLGGAYTYGARTLFTDALRVLGAENVAATGGLMSYDRASDERIVRWDPDWIVSGAEAGMIDKVRRELLARPAIAATSAARRGQIVVLDNRVFLPLSPFTSALVEAIAQALYGGGAP